MDVIHHYFLEKLTNVVGHAELNASWEEPLKEGKLQE